LLGRDNAAGGSIATTKGSIAEGSIAENGGQHCRGKHCREWRATLQRAVTYREDIEI